MNSQTEGKTDVQVQVAPSDTSQTLEQDQQRLKFGRSIPWIGLFALLYAAGSVLITLGVLKAIQGKTQWQNNYIKPASVLSIILSTTSIALHVAMESGLNVYWWRKANKSGVTVGELHTLWSQGTSLFEAAKSGLRLKLSYMAITTLFIASIPINGLLLQSAILTNPDPIPYELVPIRAPVVTRWPEGYSATYNKGNGTTPSIGLLSYAFGYNVRYWQNLEADTSASSLLVTDEWLTDMIDFPTSYIPEATFRVRGVGFNVDCHQNTTEPFNFMPDTLRNNHDYDSHILFQSNSSWNPEQDANEFQLYIKTKSDQPHYFSDPESSESSNYTYCIGDFNILQCTLEVWETEYPATLAPEEGFAIDLKENYPLYWRLSLDNSTTWRDDTYIERINATTAEGSSKTTYGGISAALEMFHGSIDFRQMQDGSYQASQQSALALAMEPYIEGDDDTEFCNTTFSGHYNSDAVLDVIRNSLRSLAFTTSADIGIDNAKAGFGNNSFPPSGMPQNVTGTVYGQANIYQISWRYYFGSLAVTLIIVGIIMPSFNKFWQLPRKTTLSPFETARAFKSPFTSDRSNAEAIKQTVRDMGHTKVHRDDSVV